MIVSSLAAVLWLLAFGVSPTAWLWPQETEVR